MSSSDSASRAAPLPSEAGRSGAPVSAGDVEAIEYRTRDKSSWGDGPWSVEPDKRQWRDHETGLPCLIVRGPGGALCGYVGVSPGHPFHGVDYGQEVAVDPAAALALVEATGFADLYAQKAASGHIAPEQVLSAHGGITYADACGHGDDPTEGVCHIPAPGEPDDVWWFGFDCAHYGDCSPAWSGLSRGGVYRSIQYVEDQCAALAQQLATVRGGLQAERLRALLSDHARQEEEIKGLRLRTHQLEGELSLCSEAYSAQSTEEAATLRRAQAAESKLQSLAAAMGRVERLRDAGWSVAVHNDYRLNGERFTFWLFTHPDGRWVKGEGSTDAQALGEIEGMVSDSASPTATPESAAPNTTTSKKGEP